MLLFLIGLALTIVPMWQLTKQAGYSPAWSLVSATGLGLVVLLWVVAFGRRTA
jgi:Kef-type K+ transport system membrane component KefB